MKTLDADRGINETELMIEKTSRKSERVKELERERERGGYGRERCFSNLAVSVGGAFLIYKRGIRFFIALFAPLFQQA